MRTIRAASVSLILMLTFISCSTPQKIEEKNKDSTIAMNKINLPVGMAELSCKIKEILEINGTKFCLARIIKVHGYGSSVKALAEENVYEFEIDKNLINEFEHSSIVGKIIRCKLVKLPKGMNLNSPDKLKIVSIVKQ